MNMRESLVNELEMNESHMNVRFTTNIRDTHEYERVNMTESDIAQEWSNRNVAEHACGKM